jgi:hypothetical protein
LKYLIRHNLSATPRLHGLGDRALLRGTAAQIAEINESRTAIASPINRIDETADLAIAAKFAMSVLILIELKWKRPGCNFATATTRCLENLNDAKTAGGSSRRSVSTLSRHGRIVERAPTSSSSSCARGTARRRRRRAASSTATAIGLRPTAWITSAPSAAGVSMPAMSAILSSTAGPKPIAKEALDDEQAQSRA